MSDAVSSVSDVPFPTDSPKSLSAVPAGERRLRLWPGVVLVLLQAALMFVPGWVAPGTFAQFMLQFWGVILCSGAVVLWWLFASRLRWADRLLLLAGYAVGGGAAMLLCHPSYRFGLLLYSLPISTTAWVLWLLVTFSLGWPVRRLGLLAVFLAVWGGSLLVRMAGVDGSFSAEFHWRWTPTPEEQFLAQYRPREAEQAGQVLVTTSQVAEWPGFRGPERDGRLMGVRIGTDWAARPPREVWRHRVGPGWGSFAVVGRLLYTQEQRDKADAVVCYDADTGKEVWVHEDKERFEETVSGAGPRATPTFDEGKVYALSARGRLNCLDASTGNVVWTRDAREDAGAAVPVWGFASSPLVFEGVVTVFTGAKEGKSVSAYDAANGGAPLWRAGQGDHSYCSPQLARLGNVEQILITSNAGLTALHPTKGDVFWHYDWPTDGGTPRCVQPAVIDDTDVLLATGMGKGERRVRVERRGNSWGEPTEVWPSRALNAYFNDRVLHKGHVYGFDGNMFTCLSLDTGKARWRGGRYGNGQVLLLADQDLLLVLSEKGEAILVAADPEKHRELARFQAIEGKTWNHPVVARGKLFVRNGEEAACYELPEWKE